MKRYTLLLIFCLLLVLSACTSGNGAAGTQPVFVTPTSFKLFSGNLTPIAPASVPAGESPATPTVANIFQTYREVPATPTIQPSPTADFSQSVSAATPSVETQTVTIYNDTFNPNWEMLASEEMNADAQSTAFVSSGKSSIAITPGRDYGTVYFVVQPAAKETYPRSRVLGLQFKLNSGDGILENNDLLITVIGSNQYPYFVLGDTSVTNTVDPVFPETRLYYLHINQAIPPHTWVDVNVWLDDLIYDPIYQYVTGFYIKNDEGFRSTFYIDDIRLITLPEAPTVTPLLSASMNGTPGAEPQPVTEATKMVYQNSQVKPVTVNVDLQQNTHPISPLIYGITSRSRDTLWDIKPGMDSWGDSSSSRFNWKLGNAWNMGVDGAYTNTDYDIKSGSASDQTASAALQAGATMHISLPTLGWVAKNSNPNTCSFPLPDGSCGNASSASCLQPGETADPNLANVQSNVDFVTEWVKHLLVYSNVKIFTVGHEPDLWGIAHYDVHPQCTTYQEMLDRYLQYALPVREAAPKALLAGPAVSGWEHYWNSPAGFGDKQQNGNQDFLPWFLDQLKKHDAQTGAPSIDVLDIHYFPEGINNAQIDAETAGHRSRAPRSLWDPTYIDKSSINEPVNLIPRMQDLIAQHYPGLKLGIGEWNFGADNNINGAIAIADVLGIFGREDVYYASYAGAPSKYSPGSYAFKLYTNYDGYGSKFAGTSAYAMSDAPDLVTAYAAVDKVTGQIHLMVINKHPSSFISTKISFADPIKPKRVMLYRYSRETLDRILTTTPDWPEDGVLQIPPYSISHYIITP